MKERILISIENSLKFHKILFPFPHFLPDMSASVWMIMSWHYLGHLADKPLHKQIMTNIHEAIWQDYAMMR